MKSYIVEVFGKVQSVGFRPFVYNLSRQFGINGFIRNKTSSVEIFIQGEDKIIEKFLDTLKLKLPPQAVIENIYVKEITEDVKYSEFKIVESEHSQPTLLYLPADIKICNQCLEELVDPSNRRYLYPFINCTQCGPRFTIIKPLPYDRENTTMDVFRMCDECYNEYVEPSNRR
ncbi:MAG: acylphosphatase, partial [Endomicrobia bacterium]|nr:acylphosphatase [Endomicrobiia bacterium]